MADGEVRGVPYLVSFSVTLLTGTASVSGTTLGGHSAALYSEEKKGHSRGVIRSVPAPCFLSWASVDTWHNSEV